MFCRALIWLDLLLLFVCVQIRTRACTNPFPQFGGAVCPNADAIQRSLCNTANCNCKKMLCVFVYLFVCLFVCVCVSVCLSVCLSVKNIYW